MDDKNEDKEKDIKNENEIEVVIGDSSDINFSEVGNFVEELKPKVEKKTNIIIPGSKKKNDKKDDEKEENKEEEKNEE